MHASPLLLRSAFLLCRRLAVPACRLVPAQKRHVECLDRIFSCDIIGILLLQELLAAQLIQTFADIFAETSLPLYLRPYEV